MLWDINWSLMKLINKKERLKRIIRYGIIKSKYIFMDNEFEKLTNSIADEILKKVKIEFIKK